MTSQLRRLFAWENRILKGFTLWPTIVMLLYLLDEWIFYYGFFDNQVIIIIIFTIIYPAVCIISALVLLLRKKLKYSVSFIFPVLISVVMFYTGNNPIKDIFFASRHYVEFHIQKSFYFPEMNDPDKLPPYKEWPLKKTRSFSEYTIIYNLKDSVDEIEKNKIRIKYGCGYYVTGVGKHFYMLVEFCK
jgi:hypothetical protein